jgi:hypothetical protein
MYTEEDVDSNVAAAHAIHWLVCLETYKEVRAVTLGHYWDLDYSDLETCVYRLRCNRKRIIVGFRGTASQKDLYDDWKITMSEIFPRAQQGRIFLYDLLTKEFDLDIELTGHSLGGAIAREVPKGWLRPKRVVTFNAAAPPTSPVISESYEVNYHIVFDIISAWQSPYTVRIDKGFRPIPSWWQKSLTILWVHASLSDLVKSHSLVNFSNERAGVVICGEDETIMINNWLGSLHSNLRRAVMITMFGIKGSSSIPSLHGCYNS